MPDDNARPARRVAAMVLAVTLSFAAGACSVDSGEGSQDSGAAVTEPEASDEASTAPAPGTDLATSADEEPDPSVAGGGAQPPGLPDQPIAEVPSSVPGVTLELWRVVRIDGGVHITFAGRSDDGTQVPINAFSTGTSDYSVAGLSFVDTAGLKRYLVLETPDGDCVCSSVPGISYEPGQRSFHFAVVTAPPADVTSGVVDTPIGSFPGVQIEDA